MRTPGRPPAERKTGQTRVWDDQAVKLSWLYRLQRTESAAFIGPLIEAELNAAFEKIRPLVEQVQQSKREKPAAAQKPAGKRVVVKKAPAKKRAVVATGGK